MKDEISENTKVRIGLVVSVILAICGALVTVTMIYAEHRTIPERVKEVEAMQTEQCYFLKNMQTYLLKPSQHYNIECRREK